MTEQEHYADYVCRIKSAMDWDSCQTLEQRLAACRALLGTATAVFCCLSSLPASRVNPIAERMMDALNQNVEFELSLAEFRD